MATSLRKKFEKKGTFLCHYCGLSDAIYDFGRTCPFSSGLV